MVNKKQLYEQIMSCVAKEVKKYINENEFNMISDLDNDNTDINLSTKTINNKLSHDNAALNTAQRLYSELREWEVNFIYVKDDHFCLSYDDKDIDIDKKYKYVIILGDSYTGHLKDGYYLDDNCEEFIIHLEDDDWDLPDVIFTTNIESAQKCIDSINNDSYFSDKTSWEFDVDWAVYNIKKDFTANNYWCEGIYEEDKDNMSYIAHKLNIH